MKLTVFEKSIDPATQSMLEKAENEGIETVWDRYEKQLPQCSFGQLGICCRNCNMGPCRIDPFGEGADKGICGATADIIVARNLLRMIAAGAAAHSDHARDAVLTFKKMSEGEAGSYGIKGEAKLFSLASEYGILAEGKSREEVAGELANALLTEFGKQNGPLLCTRRAPGSRRRLWAELGIEPRGIDREIVECMHRTHMGVDNDATHILLHGLRTGLSDGWGGSMIATDVQDILFGTPEPKKSTVNLGVLSPDKVNVIVHGHEPILSEMIVETAEDPELLGLAKEKGAAGINVAGICCTGNETLMRHGTPIAGTFLQQELAVITGAVEAMVVDVQCIMPSLGSLTGCYHTKFISTSPKADFPGTLRMEFHEEKAYETAKEIVKTAVENFPNRNLEKVNIPEEKQECMVGFSAEAILKALGGSPAPLIEAIAGGAVKGIGAVVGCNNVKIQHNYGHVNLVKELIRNNVLVVTTGCNAIACAEAGLLVPEAAVLAGNGLKGICEALDIPPVLHMGSCVDISRILVLASAIANSLGVDISDLPAAGAAPEWMSEKAVSIGAYVVSSGVFTVLGTVPPVLGSQAVTSLLTKGLDGVIGASFAVEPDPFKAADMMLERIEGKRKALGLK
ncbi:Carbon monoxide dehydrogenase CooS subunit [Methanosarcina horonobensis HB-1 = JCM 15518]|uniref:Carbon monoxide dehydrogenase n=1 Tax=Methanosarcina horonobensis HB-1 = JCM 15518 TaxID=1434110 RepID=A0A0E3SB22_9EURY|nr:anaerobic carbon-monoxide dehydrogenase catalytic subunit [Methanosarcina horonobensis]AKB78979.1 Carbon monoxide dehydrogenase CooS subunit [Methanosarcina horonobensis HB-1 = JCM 15518]